ncbi:MAG: pilus assembly PilX N-terminal domain-containing protein [candidate division Zixibacteria bacterium]|nr:pilus assembly PilX N-terminal domain-containing protein [candidate division Zixibacteria bacterium]
MISQRLTSQRGMALFIALMLTLMISIIGIGIIKTSNDEVTIAGNELQEMVAFYTAEAGLEKAAAALQTYYEVHGLSPSTMPAGTESLASATIAYVTNDMGPYATKKLTEGAFTGLNASVKTYSIQSIGTSLIDGSQVSLTQEFDCALVPIFQWAVFYKDELWVEPVYDMNLDGRVHSNGNMYVRSASAGATMLFEDRVTCGGDLINGFPWAGSKGPVQFTDKDGNHIDQKQDGNWIDAAYANKYQSYDTWFEASTALWGGMVRDQSFGEKPLNLPLSGSGDAHKLIERADGGNVDSYENKADLKILDGVPYSWNGSAWIDIAASLPAGTIKQDASVEFYDHKEKKQVRNTQIDVGLLSTSAYFPNNGIIYVSDQLSGSYINGTTLVNGDDLNGKPMTVACENPVYIQGDFNTQDKQPAAVMTDAMYFLSNNWNYANSTEFSSLSSRIPTATEANVSFITGDVAPDIAASNHQGGLENLPRFLEDWRGKELKIRGSMIQMWRSQQAIGDYTYGQYYTAPSRNWGFDTDLSDPSKLPPGTPSVRVFQRMGWKQEYVGIATSESN